MITGKSKERILTSVRELIREEQERPDHYSRPKGPKRVPKAPTPQHVAWEKFKDMRIVR